MYLREKEKNHQLVIVQKFLFIFAQKSKIKNRKIKSGFPL